MSDTTVAADPFEEEHAEADADAYDHLEDVDDGCGCAEMWEELSEQREE